MVGDAKTGPVRVGLRLPRRSGPPQSVPTPDRAGARRARRRDGPLRQAEAKLARAEVHLADLPRIAATPSKGTIRNDQQVEVVSFDRGAGQVVIIHFGAPPAPGCAAVVGDAVHNIRAAFDYLAVALGSPPIGGGEPEKIYFPFGATPERFARELSRKLGGAPERAKELVRALEPWDGGRHELRALHRLDIQDKHRLALSLTTLTRVDEVEIRHRDGRRERRTCGETRTPVNGAFEIRLDCPGVAAIDEVDATIRRSSVELAFASGQPLAGRPVAPTLAGFIAVARAFIAECRGAFPELDDG